MQQPELLPAQHPARFSICQFMAERHQQMEATHRHTGIKHCPLETHATMVISSTSWEVYVMKWGWLPSVSSNFSRKVTSQVSPGLRHSSFCKQQQQRLTWAKVVGKKKLWWHFTHQNRNDAFVLLFNQVTDDFVVKVLYCLPLKFQQKEWVFREL